MHRDRKRAGSYPAAALVACGCLLLAAPLAADTYRWKDKDGRVHYGAAVPAEYADQPYDVLNDAGIVIKHIENTREALEAIEAKNAAATERKPLISDEVRQSQSDRLLLVQYGSEDDIKRELELEIAQLGYDTRIIEQSLQSTNEAIRENIRHAANQQRANLPLSADQQEEIRKLYARRNQDLKKQLEMQKREERIRERFQAVLERYRFLTSDEPPADQG